MTIMTNEDKTPAIHKRIVRKIWHCCYNFLISIRPDLVKKDNEKMEIYKKEQEILNQNRWLMEKDIKSVLDIGANIGQFAKKARFIFPEASIYSFEAIPDIYEMLVNNFSSDKKFKSYNIGLGNEKGETTFYVNDFSDSSSFLKMNNTHKENFPITNHGEKAILVNIDKLDNIISVEEIEPPYLVKLDVQGFEREVILGGKTIIGNADYVISEVSFVELYEGQILFDTVYEMMKELDFEYIGSFGQLRSYVNNEIMQADAIFRRRYK